MPGNVSFVTAAGTKVTIDLEAVTSSVGLAVDTNSITTDAQWATAVATVFNATNASGLTPLARTFLIRFFDKLIKVG